MLGLWIFLLSLSPKKLLEFDTFYACLLAPNAALLLAWILRSRYGWDLNTIWGFSAFSLVLACDTDDFLLILESFLCFTNFVCKLYTLFNLRSYNATKFDFFDDFDDDLDTDDKLESRPESMFLAGQLLINRTSCEYLLSSLSFTFFYYFFYIGTSLTIILYISPLLIWNYSSIIKTGSAIYCFFMLFSLFFCDDVSSQLIYSFILFWEFLSLRIIKLFYSINSSISLSLFWG